MRRLANSSKKNKGFSLIEVLVAMAVITLISIPLLRTFITSAKINNKAKKLQNATDIAQNVSENFTTIPLFTLMQNNDGNVDSEKQYCGEYYQDENIVVFKNLGDGSVDEDDVPYFKGNDGEKFYVTVTMSPDEYSKTHDIVGVQDINDYIVPSMGDLFSTDVVTAYSQFTKYDNRVKTAFKNEYPSEAIFQDINSYGYDDIKKEIYVYIDQKKNGEKVDYEYRLTVKYIYSPNYAETSYFIDYDFTLARGTITSAEDMPELFLLYTPFDRYDTSYVGNARDEIYISYMSGQNLESWERETNVYIVEQHVTRALNKDNVWLRHHNNFWYANGTADYGSTSNPNLQVYSTITGWPKNVTAGTDHLLELYEVNVYVRYNKPDGNAVTAYTTTNFDISDVYTEVSAIKEERPR